MKLISLANPLEIEILCHYLQSHSIDCQVFLRHTQSVVGEIPLDDENGCMLWLNEPYQEKEAKYLIDTWLQSKTQSLPSWQCQQCREINEGQFEICWQCQTPMP